MKKIKIARVVEEVYEIPDEIAEVVTAEEYWKIPNHKEVMHMWHHWCDTHKIKNIMNIQMQD